MAHAREAIIVLSTISAIFNTATSKAKTWSPHRLLSWFTKGKPTFSANVERNHGGEPYLIALVITDHEGPQGRALRSEVDAKLHNLDPETIRGNKYVFDAGRLAVTVKTSQSPHSFTYGVNVYRRTYQ